MDRDPTLASPHRGGWLIVALLLLIQFGLFRQVALREIAPRVPMGYDQITYLGCAYRGYEAILKSGLWEGTFAVQNHLPATGCLMPIQAIGFFLVLGPGRLVALLPHFLYLAAF